MNRPFNHIKRVVMLAVLFFTLFQVLPAVAAATISNLNNLRYTEQQGWANLDSSVTVWTVDTSNNQMWGQSWAEGPVGFPNNDSDPNYDDYSSGSNSASVTSEAAYNGTYGLKLEISGQVNVDCGTAHGPTVLSSPFSASAGDTLSMYWSAAKTSDYYDVFGFVENIDTGAWQRLFHETGDSVPWQALNTSISTSVCSSGVCNLRFRFINGTYDQTCGQAIGSYLYIDGISVEVAAVATNSIVESVIESIQYQNNSDNPPNSRSYTLSHNDGTGVGSSSASINITGVNDNPTDISLSANHVTENQSSGTVVGTLSSTDVDSGSFIYSILNGVPFTTSGSQLVTTAALDHEGSGGSYSVQIQTSDGSGGSYAEWFTVNVTNANDAPTDITLSNNTVNENQSAGTLVGTLSSTDQDRADSHSYTIAGGDTAYFRIAGNQLQTNEVLNFESKSTYSVQIQTNDGNGGLYSETVGVTVLDTNDTPSDLALDRSDVDENAGADTVVGSFSTTDEDPANTHTYSLVSGSGDSDNSSFNISGADLRINAPFDFETKNSYSIRVRTTDNGTGALYREEQVTITVNDLNEVPQDLALSVSVIGEDKPAGIVVGTFRTTDFDAGDSFTYAITGGDTAAFTIDGVALKTAAIFNHTQQASYSIDVRTTDSGGLARTESFTIYVVNAAPYVAYIDSSRSNQPVVMATYDNSSWFEVGGGLAHTNVADELSAYLDASRVPWIGIKDLGNSGRATVLRYIYGAWEIVGAEGFTPGTASEISLAVDVAGTPYLAFSDGNAAGRLSVMTYDGSSWVMVGSAGISAGTVSGISIDTDSLGNPYVAYSDGAQSGAATLVRWSGSAWQTVGSAGFTPGAASELSLLLNSSNTPYLAFSDAANGGGLTVMAYSGSWQSMGGTAVSAGEFPRQRQLCRAGDGRRAHRHHSGECKRGVGQRRSGGGG